MARKISRGSIPAKVRRAGPNMQALDNCQLRAYVLCMLILGGGGRYASNPRRHCRHRSVPYLVSFIINGAYAQEIKLRRGKMKKWLVLAMGFAVISAGSLVAKEAKAQPYAFTLANSGGGPSNVSPAISFTLAAVTTGSGSSAYGEGCETQNTWFGCNAFYNNVTGDWNTAIGYMALHLNTTGGSNTAVGRWALRDNLYGNNNTAVGDGALVNIGIVGTYNTAVGNDALAHTTGNGNTAIGHGAFNGMGWTGDYNTALGSWTGCHSDCPGGEFRYSIFLGANVAAQPGDSYTIRIGSPYNSSVDPPEGQNRTFIAGIVETQLTSEAEPNLVGITSEGRLGTFSSGLLPAGPPGSLLFLRSGYSPPAGYAFIGTTDIVLMQPNKKGTKITVYVYQKQ